MGDVNYDGNLPTEYRQMISTPFVQDVDEGSLQMRVKGLLRWSHSAPKDKNEVTAVIFQPISREDVPKVRNAMYVFLGTTNSRFGNDRMLNLIEKYEEDKTIVLLKCKSDYAEKLIMSEFIPRLDSIRGIAIYAMGYEPNSHPHTKVTETRFQKITRALSGVPAPSQHDYDEAQYSHEAKAFVDELYKGLTAVKAEMVHGEKSLETMVEDEALAFV